MRDMPDMYSNAQHNTNNAVRDPSMQAPMHHCESHCPLCPFIVPKMRISVAMTFIGNSCERVCVAWLVVEYRFCNAKEEQSNASTCEKPTITGNGTETEHPQISLLLGYCLPLCEGSSAAEVL